MNEYKLTENGVLRYSDGAYIPSNTGNRDWSEYLTYTDEGGLTDPMDVPVSDRLIFNLPSGGYYYSYEYQDKLDLLMMKATLYNQSMVNTIDYNGFPQSHSMSSASALLSMMINKEGV